MDFPQIDDQYFPQIDDQDNYRLDVYLVDGRVVDVRVDGESVFPTWFKLEFKESGDVSAKVKGVRLSSRRGDSINVHLGFPEIEIEPTPKEMATAESA